MRVIQSQLSKAQARCGRAGRSLLGSIRICTGLNIYYRGDTGTLQSQKNQNAVIQLQYTITGGEVALSDVL